MNEGGKNGRILRSEINTTDDSQEILSELQGHINLSADDLNTVMTENWGKDWQKKVKKAREKTQNRAN